MTTQSVVNTPPPPPPPPLYPPPPYAPGAIPVQNVMVGQSIAALVIGCCSMFFYFTLIAPASAIVLAAIAMRAQRAAGQRPNGMAVAGLVLGIIFSLFGVMFWLYVTAA